MKKKGKQIRTGDIIWVKLQWQTTLKQDVINQDMCADDTVLKERVIRYDAPANPKIFQ